MRLRRTCPRALTAALVACVPLLAGAGPVSGDAPAADPYELALRWTLASLPVSSEWKPAAAAADAAPARQLPSPVSMPSGGVPDPGAYALMGLGLFAAGLALRHLSGRQRGLSKKT